MKESIIESISDQELVTELSKRWNADALKLTKVLANIKTLTQTRDMLVESLSRATAIINKIKESKLGVRVPNLRLPLNVRIAMNPKLTLGDAMEMILAEYGATTQRVIIDILNAGGFPLKQETAHILLANAVARDSQKRFKRLKDGRVTLREKGSE